MCNWILKGNGEITSSTTVQHMTNDEKKLPDNLRRMEVYDIIINERLNDDNFLIDLNEENAFFIDDFEETFEPVYTDDQDNRHAIDVDNVIEKAEEPTEDAYDAILNAEVMIDIEDKQVLGKVVKRLRDNHGRPIGSRFDNALSDTREYEVRLPDGSSRELTYNQIVINLFSQCDSEGRRFQLLESILDHRKDENALTEKDAWFTTKLGKKKRRITTKGWSFLIQWRDGSADWLTMRELKVSFPVELAEYAKSQGIDHEPAFAW